MFERLTYITIALLTFVVLLGPVQVGAQEGGGFKWQEFSSSDGKPGTAVVPFPAGASTGDVLVTCTVSDYETFGDDDIAWNCDWIWEEGQIRFTLTTKYAGRGRVTATGMVFDTREFRCVDGLKFVVDSNKTVVTDLNKAQRVYYGASPIKMNVPPGSIPIISVREYETNKDDDFGYVVRPDPDSDGYFYIYGEDGNSGSHASGFINVLRPVAGGWIFSDIQQVFNEHTYVKSRPFKKNAEDNLTMVFFSLIGYLPATDDDFQVRTSIPWVSPELLRVEIEASKGNSDSFARIQTGILQR